MSGMVTPTAIAIVAVTLPPELVAVTTKFDDDDSSVGVPVIRPFCVLNESPGGSAGDTDQTGKVPVAVGLSGDIAEFKVRFNDDGL